MSIQTSVTFNLARAVQGRLFSHCLSLAGLLLASHIASAASNWVSSGTPGSPIIPFDALVTGRGPAVPPTEPNPPLYTCRGGQREGYGLQIGMFVPGSKTCNFGYGGIEISVLDFEILTTSWQPASGGYVPPNAVEGGVDNAPPGSTVKPPLYYCRGVIRDAAVSLQLGKIRPGFAGCDVPYSGREVSVNPYQVLVASSPAMPLANIAADNGFVPHDAIRAGTDVDGTPLYICSAIFDGSTIPGKLHSSFHGCNVSYGGVEHTVFDYYVLVPSWLGAPFFDFPAGVDVDGNPLYVCRGLLNGGIQYPGKMQRTWKNCNYGLAGREQSDTLYEPLSH
jgi:hypothetical protein